MEVPHGLALKERVCSRRLFLVMMKDVTATGARGARGAAVPL